MPTENPSADDSDDFAEAYFEELRTRYLQVLLQGQRHLASELILQAVEDRVSVKDIYLQIFQPVQYEIGLLWQTNEVSIAQEHYCTASTQLIMSQLYPYIFNTEKKGRRLIATCVGGELHEIGLRMVADFFEMDGWDTYYLGANMPTGGIIESVETIQPDAIAISVSMAFNIETAANLIERIQASALEKRAKVLVGGRPFNVSSNLWQQVGADGYAKNAAEAINLANSLVEAAQ